MIRNTIRRRTFLTGDDGLPTFAILTRRSDAAQFRWKLATGQEPKAKRGGHDRDRMATTPRSPILITRRAQFGKSAGAASL